MSEPTRRSMVGAPPSAAKSFFKANPPKRESKQEAEKSDAENDGEESIKSEGSVEADNQSRLDIFDSQDRAGVADETIEDLSAEPAKRKRRKRRIRLTDHGVKAKKRFEKRVDKKDSNDDDSKENGESLSKKENVEEVVVKKPSLNRYTPFQLLCDYILRKLILKDPEEYFVHPVSPFMAPDYLTIIKKPMDFTTIRSKIERNEYNHIDEFHADVNLIGENAITYNQLNTVYHLAAQKLSTLIKYYMSEQFLEYIRYSAPFGKEIPLESIGILSRTTATCRHTPSKSKNSKNDFLADDLSVNQIIESSDDLVKSRLTGRVPSCGIGYLDNRDGALALNILVGPTSEKPRLTLADVVKPLDKGNPGLLNLAEPRLCLDYAISYTDPGPFASFAPQFDSTWATLNKRDSELLFACYGDQQNATDALSLRHMVSDCDESYLKYVDNMLDQLTEGEHSRTIKALVNEEEKSLDVEKLNKKPLTVKELLNILDDVSSLQNIGLDLSFIDDLKIDLGLVKNKTKSTDEILQRTDVMLEDLTAMNYARLSAQPSMTLTDTVPPSYVETQLANNVINELNNEIKIMGVKPEDVVSTKAIHHSFGLNDEDDDDDFDLLREFISFKE